MTKVQASNDTPLILNNNTTFDDAIRAIECNGNGYLALIDNQRHLIGILTDGDVRRAILEKKNNLLDIINRNPYSLSPATSQNKIITTLKKMHRRHMPLVDDNGIYSGVFTLDQVDFNVKSNKVIVMAGGLGSRLGSLTEAKPKSMLEVGGKPMLEHLIRMFAEKGYFDFIFCVNYKKDIIKDYFKNGDTFGVKIDYVEEPTRLGTAGALSLVKGMVDSSFFVVNSDVLTNVDFEQLHQFHIDQNSTATMCVRNLTYEIPYGVIRTDEQLSITSIDEKPTLSFSVNAGIYHMEPTVLDLIPNNVMFDMPLLFSKIIQMDYKTTTYDIIDYWIDIGNITDYKKANDEFCSRFTTKIF